jgi:hypothetical protein
MSKSVEHPANRDLPVDCGAAADAAAAPIDHRLLEIGATRLERTPHILLIVFAGENYSGWIRDSHLGGRLRGAVVGTRFEQQYPARGIFRQPRSKHGARRACTHDDDVVVIRHPSRFAHSSGSRNYIVSVVSRRPGDLPYADRRSTY